MGKLNYSYLSVVTPTLDTNAYASGDRLGSIMEVTGALSAVDSGAVLQSMVITDAADQGTAIDVLFFSDLPTIASADNAAIDIADAQASGKYLGKVSFAAADYVDYSGNKCIDQKNIGLGLFNTATDSGGNSRTSVWALAVCRSGTPTYAASSLCFKFFVLKD